jgi:hypothetical protein
MDTEEERVPVSSRGGLEAHALSLHLYSILDRVLATSEDLTKAVDDIRSLLKSQSLQEHIEVSLKKEKPGIGLEAKTEFGGAVLSELYSRCEFFPCPEGECEYAPMSFCKWCGNLKR